MAALATEGFDRLVDTIDIDLAAAEKAAADAGAPPPGAADPDVALASPPQLNEDETAVIWQVIPNSGPQEKETIHLVERLRDDLLPPVEGETGVEVLMVLRRSGGMAV